MRFWNTIHRVRSMSSDTLKVIRYAHRPRTGKPNKKIRSRSEAFIIRYHLSTIIYNIQVQGQV